MRRRERGGGEGGRSGSRQAGGRDRYDQAERPGLVEKAKGRKGVE
jgi:hypothetical protein